MSKKKGLFSWFSKKPAKETEQAEKDALLESLKKEAQQNNDQNVDVVLDELAEVDLQAESLSRKQAELAAKEQTAAEETQQQAELLLAREREELTAKEQAAAEETQQQAELLLAREREELAAKEQAAAEETQQQAELLLARERKELAAKEKAAAEEVERQAQLLFDREQAEQEEQAAIEAQLLLEREQEDKERAVEEAQRQAQLLLEREQADLEAQEQATKARLAYQEAQRSAELAREQVQKEAIEEQTQNELAEQEGAQQTEVRIEEKKETKELGFFARFAQGLKKTRLNIGSGLLSLFKGKKIDDDLFEELEEQLIVADIGVETTLRIIDNLTEHANRKQLKDAEVLYELLKKDLSDILQQVEKPLVIDQSKKPFVILMVGVNGVGKTTTIGKLAKKYQSEGKSVMLAAGDTFRAAAVEQLQVWGERNNIPVIAQQTGADSASVLFDAMDAANARGIDVLIADTAGRLQNKDHLMDELAKVVRIMRKKDPTAPHEIMLTIDAGTGQNAISQVKLFNQAVGLTGVTFTKLDGTAKGGIIFSIADQFKLPIRYIGVGEGIDDLREFNAKEFIDALFSKEDES
tara:strand:- start:5151 stop:6896 length:1746 start_codon:yes stop_codon:yes gene_type:complete